jgi:hypothetical protein
LGDFSIIADIPQMYNHCKTVEDKDMTPIEFITDHLLNIDGMFDCHQNGDTQKPHQPLQHNHPTQTVCSFITIYSITYTEIIESKIEPILYKTDFTLSNYTAKIFRPPIQA